MTVKQRAFASLSCAHHAFQGAGDYREQAGQTAASRAQIDARDTELLETRLQLALARAFNDAALSVRLGWQQRDDRGDQRTTVRLLSQSRELAFDARLGSNFYAGGEAHFKIAGGLLLNLSGEAVFGSHRYRNLHGLITLSKPF